MRIAHVCASIVAPTANQPRPGQGTTALTAALRGRFDAIVKLLLAAGADPNVAAAVGCVRVCGGVVVGGGSGVCIGG